MATLTSKEIIDEMIENDGCYQGDPPCCAIYEYQNQFNKTVWFVAYAQADFHSLFNSPYVQRETIKQLWPKTEPVEF